MAETSIRVAFVDHSGLPGGGQLGLARYLQHHSPHDRMGVILGGGDAFKNVPASNLSTLGASTSRWGYLRSFLRFRRFMRSYHPDVAVANSTKAAIVVGLSGRIGGTLRVMYLRSDVDPARMGRVKQLFMTRVLLPRFDAFIANSHWTRSTLPPRLRERPTRVCYPVSGASSGSAESRTVNSGPLRVLSLSRIARWKGIDVLLDAMETINKRGLSEKVSLQIAGAAHHEDSDFEREFQVRASGFSNVKILGHVADVSGLLQEADVLVLASTQPEPFGQVIVQALSAGLLVIATNHGGPPEILSDHESGILIPPANSDALADEIAWAIRHPVQVEQIASTGRVASERFSDRETCASLDRALDDLVALSDRRSLSN